MQNIRMLYTTTWGCCVLKHGDVVATKYTYLRNKASKNINTVHYLY